MKAFEVRRTLYGHDIVARVTVLDCGMNVLLVGGELSHVGAVSFAPNLQTVELLTHREGVISERWATELYSATNAPVCVQCGIHYDNATQEQIAEIVKLCNEMLIEVRDLV